MKHPFLFIFTTIAAFLGVAVAHAAPIPGLEFLNVPADADIGKLFPALYIWGIGFVALAAFGAFTWGGIRYMTAGGDQNLGEAKQWMRNAIYGLLLALGSYLILYTINPQLVTIKNLELPPITSNGSGGSGPGGGAQSYAIINVPSGQLCKDVKGDNWVGVAGSLCSGQPLSGNQQCCGYFPQNNPGGTPSPKPTASNCTTLSFTTCENFENCRETLDGKCVAK